MEDSFRYQRKRFTLLRCQFTHGNQQTPNYDEDLGKPLIQKTMTRARFLEILENIHFADNHKELPPKESQDYDSEWKLRPLFDHLGKRFQNMLQPEAHQSIDEHMSKFKGKSLMGQYMKNKPIKWGFKFNKMGL